MIEVVRANFGERVSLDPAKTSDRVVFYRDGKHWFLDEPTREVRYDEYTYSYGQQPTMPAQFERADFGDRDRLAWPAGACAINQRLTPNYWGERFAFWIDDDKLVLVDATRSSITHVALPGLVGGYPTSLVHGPTLWLQGDAILGIPLAALEGLFDQPAGRFEVHVQELYPGRKRDAAMKARIKFLEDAHVVAQTLGKLRTVRFPARPGVAVAIGMDVTLHDELYLDRFLAIELPDKPRVELYGGITTESKLVGMLTHEPAVDPAGQLTKAATTTRQEDLDRLLSALADDPDDEATRLVILDTLEDAGEPYAPQLARLVAGETDVAARREALGTLASYIERVDWRGGLPYAGTLAAKAPLDDDIGNIVAADQRLGFFHTLRLGDGHYNVYAKLVSSPRAVGLRHVDGSRHSILAALIAGKRRVTRLSDVKFATREVIEALADSTFDSVQEIETFTAGASVAKLLDFVARDELKFFARAPRHLVLQARAVPVDALVEPVLAMWDRLPLAKLSVASCTLSRDGTAEASRLVSMSTLSKLRTRFKVTLGE